MHDHFWPIAAGSSYCVCLYKSFNWPVWQERNRRQRTIVQPPLLPLTSSPSSSSSFYSSSSTSTSTSSTLPLSSCDPSSSKEMMMSFYCFIVMNCRFCLLLWTPPSPSILSSTTISYVPDNYSLDRRVSTMLEECQESSKDLRLTPAFLRSPPQPQISRGRQRIPKGFLTRAMPERPRLVCFCSTFCKS